MAGPSVPTMQIVSFDMQSIRGDADLSIQQKGFIAGHLDPLAADPVLAGDRVKLDATYTGHGLQFVAAADNEAAFGVAKRTSKAATFNAGDEMEVSVMGGPVVNEVSGTTLTPGTPVAMTSGFLSAVDGTHLQMGLLLDYAVESQMARVLMGWVAC